MERRTFIKVSSMSLIGSDIPAWAIANNPAPILVYALTAWRYFKTAVEVASTIQTAYHLVKDFFGDDESQCCNKVDEQLRNNGYSRRDDISTSYVPPKPLPTMPSKYGAFAYAKIKPNEKSENTQILFLAKNHERKELITLLPESLIYALCCAAEMITASQLDIKKEADKAKLQSMLLPAEKTGYSSDEKTDFMATTFKTFHGTFEFIGSIDRDKTNGKPKFINGKFVIQPNETIIPNDNDPFSKEYRLPLNNVSLDFIFT